MPLGIGGAIVIHNEFKAKKDYQSNCCKNDISAGENYIRLTIPPWEDVEGDVDENGRSIYFLRAEEDRRWGIMRFHIDCYLDQGVY
jgi:hypothetical protein